MTPIAHPTKKGYRTIRLPLTESAYDRLLTDRSYATARREDLHEECAALFPDAFPRGYAFFGSPEPSLKQQLLGRRIRLEQGRTVFTLAPAFVMPSMTGRTQDVDHALFLRRLPVPCWAMAHVFGREAMSWDRLEQGVGRCSLVGTTVTTPERFPKDLVADEKQSGWKGERVSIATTAAQAGLVGASVAPSASQADLAKASGVFASDARPLDANEAPQTVKTDGWQATQGAWKALCTPSTVILCFLQAFLNIRDRATKTLGEVLAQVQKRGWEAYHAPSKRAFSQRLRRLRQWAETAIPEGVMQSPTLDLCNKRAQFSKSYDHPEAQRTSTRVDRLMKFVDRAFFPAHYFHGMADAAASRVRALALLWNFGPSSPQTVRKHAGQACPAERLSGKRYADNWLENLLVCGSMNGVEQDPQNPL